MKQSNYLEICPRSLTVVSPESCRVAMYVKCSEDSDRMNRKSPFSTTPFDAPSLANPREYLHKPYYRLLPETTFPGLYILTGPLGSLGSSANFRSFVRSRRRQVANPLVAETETDLYSRPFKVIYFGIIEQPLLRGYMAQ